MASQTLSLGNVPGDVAWSGSILIDTALVSGGGVAYLRMFELVGSSSRLSIALNATDDPALAGPELTSTWELYASAIVFDDADGNSLTLKGPAHPDNSFNDDTEQYFWTPDNFSDWNTYWISAHTALTLTLDDGGAAGLTIPVIADQTGEVGQAYSQTLPPAIDGTLPYTYTAVPIPPGFSFNSLSQEITGTPTAASTTTVVYGVTDSAVPPTSFERSFDIVISVALLVLANFDDSGLEVDVAALLVASAPGTIGNNLYANSDRSGTDTPLDGELGLSATETVISRIRRLETALIVLNDNDNPAVLDLDTYFGAGGDGSDLTFYLQTSSDGLVSFAVADQLDTSGESFLRLNLPADAQILLDNIDIGDRWIFALARPTPAAVDHTVDAGAVTWTFDVPQPTVTRTPAPVPTDHMVDAGPVSWTFDVPEPTVIRTPIGLVDHTVDAGAVAWSFDIPQPTVTHILPGGIDVGKAERLGLLQRITYQTNRIDLACKQWLGSDSDANRRNFIRWNFGWFQSSPTFWLPVGRLFWISRPE